MFSGAKPDADTLFLLDMPEQMQSLQPVLHQYIASICGDDVSSDSTVPALGGIWFTATEPVSNTSNERKSYFVVLVVVHIMERMEMELYMGGEGTK